MSLYTERHGMRNPIEKTYIISIDHYALLFDICDQYKEYLAWKYPEECPDGLGCCGINNEKLNRYLKFVIPSLFSRDGSPAIPEIHRDYYDVEIKDKYDQYALLDYIEFIAQNCKDFEKSGPHKFFAHYHYDFSDTSSVFERFKDDINNVFTMTGLLYVMTENKTIERVIDESVVSPDLIKEISTVKEKGIRELLDDAITRFKAPDPDAPRDAAEKIWDAFERLKTYYTSMDKQTSSTQIIQDMADRDTNYINLFTEEFKTLTKIGNDYRIRHHETSKIDIPDPNYYDYFFNRCLSLIGLAIKYLK